MFLTNEQYEHAMQINESIIEPALAFGICFLV